MPAPPAAEKRRGGGSARPPSRGRRAEEGGRRHLVGVSGDGDGALPPPAVGDAHGAAASAAAAWDVADASVVEGDGSGRSNALRVKVDEKAAAVDDDPPPVPGREEAGPDALQHPSLICVFWDAERRGTVMRSADVSTPVQAVIGRGNKSVAVVHSYLIQAE